jgi:hypothetical protein
MSSDANTIQTILLQIANVLSPLQRELAPGRALGTLAEIGIPISTAQESAIAPTLQTMTANAGNLLQLSGELVVAIDADNIGDIIAKSAGLIEQVASIIQRLDDLQTAVSGLGGLPPAVVDAIPERLFNMLLVRALESATGVNELLELV